MKDKKGIQIRNSTTDFIVFTKQAGEDGIEVRVHDENIWLTQKGMAELFDCSTDNISLHLKNIFASGELQEDSVTEESSATASDGKRYKMKFYNLDAIISVGYRVNSIRATQFRQWATKVLRTFTIQGYVLDKQRLENGQIFDEAYFEHLLDEIREIRASERRFYQKITDIYSTAVDYSPTAKTSQDFFAAVQNKLHYAIHHHTAAELIYQRADHKKEHMGLTTWKNAPNGKIVKADVSIAKNYLSKAEIKELNQIVTMYLDYAERQAKRRIPMTMEDWAKRLDVFLEFNEEDILKDKGRVSAAIAKSFAESEFEKYRVIQDGLYRSDFDKLVQNAEAIPSSTGKIERQDTSVSEDIIMVDKPPTRQC
ncbi:MAG TPA: virulence RhuM family protein [Candidatus Cloacimonetes bacterium]|jgi:hypothetical protein|nr:cell filamentation protein Fic [Candidatus Cloacimonas sp.]HHZ14535.1 virulence RhuM family protein [Candidatus Cloacimonadota bacterium]